MLSELLSLLIVAGRSRPAGLLVLLLAAGCATPQTDRLLAAPGDRPDRVELDDVPFHPQERDQCGPASLAMVLEWGGVQVDPSTLRAQIFTPGRSGSLQSDIVAAARRHGRVAYPVSTLDELSTELSAGHPVLVLQNLGHRLRPARPFDPAAHGPKRSPPHRTRAVRAHLGARRSLGDRRSAPLQAAPLRERDPLPARRRRTRAGREAAGGGACLRRGPRALAVEPRRMDRTREQPLRPGRLRGGGGGVS
jgi:hypothetical protein